MLEARMNQGKDGDEVRTGEGSAGGVELWAAPSAGGPLSARVALPGSKSLTGRELVLAALADGSGTLRAPLHSRDSALMVDALRALGTGVEGGTGFSPRRTGTGEGGPRRTETHPGEPRGRDSSPPGVREG